jgi:hypothetical protein
MLAWVIVVLLASTSLPLGKAWRATGRSTLRQAVAWAMAAWTLWLLALLASALGDEENARAGGFLALAVTGCAGVAVLGARRPGNGPWNFVVSGLLVVLVLPLFDLREMRLRQETLPMVFLAGTVALGVANYLPTRLGPAALLLGVGCGLAFAIQLRPEWRTSLEGSAGLLVAAAPWAAWALLRRRNVMREADRVWLNFRDGFGVVWGQRVREQMNRAAANAGWPVVLRWHGLENTGGSPVDEAAILGTLRALLQRFEIEETEGEPKG